MVLILSPIIVEASRHFFMSLARTAKKLELSEWTDVTGRTMFSKDRFSFSMSGFSSHDASFRSNTEENSKLSHTI